jgi:hypothetical protein
MQDWEAAMWPRADHLYRVFQVRSGNQTDTALRSTSKIDHILCQHSMLLKQQ